MSESETEGDNNSIKYLDTWHGYVDHFNRNHLPFPFIGSFPYGGPVSSIEYDSSHTELRRRHKRVQKEIRGYLNDDNHCALYFSSAEEVVDMLAEHLKTIIFFEAKVHFLLKNKGFIRFSDSILKLDPFVEHSLKLLRHQKKAVVRWVNQVAEKAEDYETDLTTIHEKLKGFCEYLVKDSESYNRSSSFTYTCSTRRSLVNVGEEYQEKKSSAPNMIRSVLLTAVDQV